MSGALKRHRQFRGEVVDLAERSSHALRGCLGASKSAASGAFTQAWTSNRSWRPAKVPLSCFEVSCVHDCI